MAATFPANDFMRRVMVLAGTEFKRHRSPSVVSPGRSSRIGALPKPYALAAAAVVALSAASCSSGGDAPSAEAQDGAVPWPFIAQTIDFAGFCKWSSAPAAPSADAS